LIFKNIYASLRGHSLRLRTAGLEYLIDAIYLGLENVMEKNDH
jgi:hypothetical protein